MSAECADYVAFVICAAALTGLRSLGSPWLGWAVSPVAWVRLGSRRGSGWAVGSATGWVDPVAHPRAITVREVLSRSAGAGRWA